MIDVIEVIGLALMAVAGIYLYRRQQRRDEIQDQRLEAHFALMKKVAGQLNEERPVAPEGPPRRHLHSVKAVAPIAAGAVALRWAKQHPMVAGIGVVGVGVAVAAVSVSSQSFPDRPPTALPTSTTPPPSSPIPPPTHLPLPPGPAVPPSGVPPDAPTDPDPTQVAASYAGEPDEAQPSRGSQQPSASPSRNAAPRSASQPRREPRCSVVRADLQPTTEICVLPR